MQILKLKKLQMVGFLIQKIEMSVFHQIFMKISKIISMSVQKIVQIEHL